MIAKLCAPSIKMKVLAVQKFDHVAVLDDIFFSFGAHFPLFARFCIRAGIYKRIACDHFGADELGLEVGANGGARLRRCRTLLVGPCARFVFSGSKKAQEPEQAVTCAYQS